MTSAGDIMLQKQIDALRQLTLAVQQKIEMPAQIEIRCRNLDQ
jgi:hypothetical protein